MIAGKYRFTDSTLDGLTELGLTDSKATQVICNLLPEHFVKTMPSENDWGNMLDVYHAPHPDTGVSILIYVKLYEKDDRVSVTSFKPK